MSNDVFVYVVVEGQTEQTFIRDILTQDLKHKKIFLFPQLIGKPGHKGGNVKWERARTDIQNLFHQHNRKNVFISTMFDFYGLDNNWPGKARIKSNSSAHDKAALIENETSSMITDLLPEFNIQKRFIPYIEMYEFEALLFSNPAILSEKLNTKESNIDKILKECKEPEEINDNCDTTPYRRIEALNKTYRKVAMGKEIAEAIGIQTISDKCFHFNEWLNKLGNLT